MEVRTTEVSECSNFTIAVNTCITKDNTMNFYIRLLHGDHYAPNPQILIARPLKVPNKPVNLGADVYRRIKDQVK